MESFHAKEPLEVEAREPRLSVTSRSSKAPLRSTGRLSVASRSSIPTEILQDEGDEGVEDKGTGLTFIEVVMNFTIACIGAGVATYPKVMSNTGYVLTPFLMFFAAGLCCEAGALICKACDAAERSMGQPLGSIVDYESLSEAIGGAPCKGILMFSKNCAFISFIIVFMILTRDGVAKFFPGGVEGGKQIVGKEFDENAGKPMLWIHFGIVLPLFLALVMLKDLKQLAKFSTLGVVAVAIQCLFMIGESIRKYSGSEMCRATMVRDSWGNKVPMWKPIPGCVWYEPLFRHPEEDGEIFKSLSAFIFGFAILGTLPSVRSEMAQPERLPAAFRLSFLIVCFSYLVVMSIGYLAYGELVADNFIKSMSGLMAVGAAICIIVNLALTTPLFMMCVVKTFESSGTDLLRTPFTTPNVIFRMSSVVFLAIAASVMPFVLQIIGLASSIFCVINNLIMPLTLYYIACWRAKSLPSGLRMFLHVIMFLVALTILVVGTQASWSTLVQKLQTGKEDLRRTPQANGNNNVKISPD